MRLYREELIDNHGAYDYIAPKPFARSIMDLQADTEYDDQLRMTDPDGVENEAQKQFYIRTRSQVMHPQILYQLLSSFSCS